MPTKLITGPATEPITADEAKTFLRIDGSDEDALIGLVITAVREYAETVTRRAFITQTHELVLDGFPSAGIEIPNPPLQSVSYITYVDTNGDLQTLSATLYSVDVDSEPGWVVPAYGESWPVTRDQINAVRIRFVAGWADATNVPESLKTWLKMRVGAFLELREGVGVGAGASIVVPPHQFLDGLLDPWRVMTL